jgi:hypothetical protein
MGLRKVFALLLVTTSTSLGLSAVGSGCTDDDPGASSTPIDSGAPDVNRPRPLPPEDDAARPTCAEACEADHPSGLVKDRALLACWDTHCRASCIAPEAGPVTPTEDGGDAGDGGAEPACTTEVITVRATCDDCTRAACCSAWDACFQDQDCIDLNRCYQTCP